MRKLILLTAVAMATLATAAQSLPPQLAEAYEVQWTVSVGGVQYAQPAPLKVLFTPYASGTTVMLRVEDVMATTDGDPLPVGTLAIPCTLTPDDGGASAALSFDGQLTIQSGRSQAEEWGVRPYPTRNATIGDDVPVDEDFWQGPAWGPLPATLVCHAVSGTLQGTLKLQGVPIAPSSPTRFSASATSPSSSCSDVSVTFSTSSLPLYVSTAPVSCISSVPAYNLSGLPVTRRAGQRPTIILTSGRKVVSR